jgi:hypothetical protein
MSFAQPQPPPKLSPDADATAWRLLPPVKKPPLPEWARLLAAPLPKTTAKMLELDYLHREKNPLGVRFGGRLRWTVADALESDYGRETAKADLQRANALKTPDTTSEKIALAFARKLTLSGHAITDEEFATLLKHFSPEQVTAIVHTVAYANFHNRIVLAIGAKGETPVAEPIAMKFDMEDAKTQSPKRPPWDELKTAKGEGLSVRVEWSKKEFDTLAKSLGDQKERNLRIPLPDKARFEKFPPREKMQAEKIVWMTVSAGYQPELTRAWFACLNAYYEEASTDRVFSNSVFWVVTRTNDCFY